mgnify:CR=1 FL=1
MLADKKGFIVNYYTTGNGTKLTRDQVGDRILDHLKSGPQTCGTLARTLKIRKESLYNVLAWLWHNKMVTKKKGERGIYEYSSVKNCALSDLFYPTPEQVEKQFKIKGRKSYTVKDGTSKSSGRGGINPYADHYLNSSLWEGVD